MVSSLSIPTDLDESEVLATIDRILDSLTRKLKFGHYEIDDVKQELRIKAIQALPDYDRSRPLENFLRIHIRYRLHNLKRDKYLRSGPSPDDPEKKRIAEEKKESKKHLLKAGSGVAFEDSMQTFNDFATDYSNKELLEFIDARIPMNIRADYLKLLNGVSLNKHKRDKVLSELRVLWEEYNERQEG